ncbi:SPOR domain-containing protein [Oceanibacterium hippocampi]|nr:SPOR domain-containing protein [Oceanibacterium hippocampi]
MASFLLGGCALPPAITAASWALDGISLAMSGKSMTDHALSAVVDEDCAILRLLDGEPVCSEFEEGDGSVLLAADDDPVYPTGRDGGYSAIPADRTVDAATIAEAAPASAAASASGPGSQPVAARVPVGLPGGVAGLSEPRYLVLGSYRSRDHAHAMMVRAVDLRPMMVDVEVDGSRYHRVTVGPFAAERIDAARATLEARGFKETWPVALADGSPSRGGVTALAMNTAGRR